MREDFEWSQIEPQPGTFDFSRYDQYMLLTTQRGDHVLPLLFDTPSWAGPSEDSIPADPSGYAAYVAAVVGRYGPHGSFWTQHPGLAGYAIQTFELWNEPYYTTATTATTIPAVTPRWSRQPRSPGARPTPRPLPARRREPGPLVGSNWVWWIDALYQAVPDLNNYFDGVAVHPYGTNMTNLSYPTGRTGVQRLRADPPRSGDPRQFPPTAPLTSRSGSPRSVGPPAPAAAIAAPPWPAKPPSSRPFSTMPERPGRASSRPYSSTASTTRTRQTPANPENDYGLTYNDGTPKPALAVFEANAAARNRTAGELGLGLAGQGFFLITR